MMHYVAEILASCVMTLRHIFRLIIDPYKAMREIARQNDYAQIVIILIISCLYFIFAAGVRESTLNPFVITRTASESIMAFLLTFFLSVTVLIGAGMILKVSRKKDYEKLIFLSAYSLVPSFFWFFTTSTLFILLPPPRHVTMLGMLFSVVFVVYSLSLLFWRLVLLYLTIRFAFGAEFKKVAIAMALFLMWLIPYSYFMYRLGFFRVPFI